jgi:RNA polymerase sigma factor (sigma-70 family)
VIGGQDDTNWERLYRQSYPSVYRALVATLLEAAANMTAEGSQIEAVLERLSVGQLLRLLTPRQRSIVVAYFYLDQTQEQIAELLGIRRGTVAATISQALTRMRKGEGHVQ